MVPIGYSFNLDGTNIYMTLATLFLAQATNTPLTWGQELAILLVRMLTSKGASRRDRGGLHHPGGDAVGRSPTSRSPALAVLVGIDRFMSECRALTNLIGNGVACVAVARWEGELDRRGFGRNWRAGRQSHAWMMRCRWARRRSRPRSSEAPVPRRNAGLMRRACRRRRGG